VSKLIVEELITVLEQEITLQKAIQIVTIRPWLYSHNNPAGTFSFNIYNTSGLVRSFSFTNNDLKTQSNLTEAYFHTYFSIQMASFSLPRGVYTIKLEHFGYTYDANSFLGWCKDVNPIGKVYGEPENYTANPFSFTIIEYKSRES